MEAIWPRISSFVLFPLPCCAVSSLWWQSPFLYIGFSLSGGYIFYINVIHCTRSPGQYAVTVAFIFDLSEDGYSLTPLVLPGLDCCFGSFRTNPEIAAMRNQPTVSILYISACYPSSGAALFSLIPLILLICSTVLG